MINNNNWEYQKMANIASFCEDREYLERKLVLKKIATSFEKNNIRWAIVCSLNLYFRGIVDDFNDIDLLVDAEDANLIRNIMLNEIFAIPVEVPDIGFCRSDVIMYFDIGKVRVEIISGFRVLTFGTKYFYEYNSAEVEIVKIDKIKLQLINLEAMYLLYGMMEGWQQKRRYKRLLIQEYLKINGTDFPNILKDALKDDLPAWLKVEIRSILGNDGE